MCRGRHSRCHGYRKQGNIEGCIILGGKISPIDGVGPSQLRIGTLVEKVKAGSVNEVIFALSSTMEGDTTNFIFISK
jgi:recombinational DNA repair protein RecR